MHKQRLEKLTKSLVATLNAEKLPRTEHLHEVCKRLVHASDYLHRMSVAECNRELSGHERLMVDHVRFAAESYAKALGLPGICFGDPRGYSVKVRLPSGRSNDFGGAEWGIV